MAATCLTVLSGSAIRARSLSCDAFVWQLRPSAELSRAIAENSRLFATWHVLAVDLREGGTVLSHQDWAALLADGHRVVPVIRIEGVLGEERVASVLAACLAVLEGLPPRLRDAVEVDHDAASAKLASYARFLRALRAGLPTRTVLTATALPSWIGAPGFSRVAQAVDGLVLQLHAVDDPRPARLRGLFDPDRAWARTVALARSTPTPFLVALPAYGARVSGGGADRLTVSSEMPVLDGRPGEEIAADPRRVAGFLARLQRDPPDGLAGVVWFRLTIDSDRRAWSSQTLRDVVTGRPLRQQVVVETRADRLSGASDIVVVDLGADDAMLPRQIALPKGCLAADGLGQYGLDGDRLSLRGAGGLVGARHSVLAGWMRCGQGTEAGGLHAEE